MKSPNVDLAVVADLLRTRQRVLQPEDVGFPRGRRRRTPGLRREEAAALCSMSTAYYSRIERRCAPRPSAVMLAGIARGLRFSRDDRDRLFAAAGYDTDGHAHIEPGLMLVLDRLADMPAQVVGPSGAVLCQTSLARALFGDQSGYAGARRCRLIHPELGAIDLDCEVLPDADRGHRVVVYLAEPGSESHSKLQLLAVIGHHRFDG